MDKKDLFTLILFLVGVIVLIVLIVGIVKEVKIAVQEIPISEEQKEQQLNCEHEFVTVSEFDLWFKSYKTYSRCIKCGLEVK